MTSREEERELLRDLLEHFDEKHVHLEPVERQPDAASFAVGLIAGYFLALIAVGIAALVIWAV